ncbi:MAG: hypothetical protein KC415_18315 [Anaerolineales bacterium]|nr:hypothetical protein [Anaerolineales bacterium]
MMNRRFLLGVLIITCVLCLVIGGIVTAQSGGTFDLRQSTVDGGGGASLGGTFMVRGTAGQADAGMVSGGTFDLTGGFWHYRGPQAIYLPVVLHPNS